MPASRARVDLLLALSIGLASLLLYLGTLCPTVFWYDSAEYVAAAVTVGIPHPPGYPLYTLLGALWVRLLPLEPAYAMNLLSAVFGALAAALAFLVGRRLGADRLGALIGAGTLAAGELFWSQSLIAEVYGGGICFLLLALLLVLRGLDENRGRWLVLAAGIAGLGLGVHLYVATCGLGLALLVMGVGLGPIERPAALRRLVTAEALGRRAWIVGAGLGALGLGACIFFYLPWRAQQGPALNFGNPATWDRFWWMVSGGNYKRWFAGEVAFGARLATIAGLFYAQFLLLGLILAGLGLVALWRRRALLGLGLTLMLLGNLVFFFDYQVHDIEVFFLPGITVTALFVGVGASETARWIRERLAGGPWQRGGKWGGAVLALLPLSLVLANYRAVDLSDYTAARDYGEQLSRQLPRGAVIVHLTTPPEWKNDAVFSRYFQLVKGRRPDVRVLHSPSARFTLDVLRRGHRVYVYHPIDAVTRLFVVKQEGLVWRLVGPRSLPVSRSTASP